VNLLKRCPWPSAIFCFSLVLLTIYHPPGVPTQTVLQPTDCLYLRFDQRCRSRFAVSTTTSGIQVNVLVPRGTVIRNGGLLTNEAGDCLEVISADEPLYRVTASTPHALLRAAYHLGNRHIRLQVEPSYLQLEPDSVLLEMLRQLPGVDVQSVHAIFEPETGAYGGGHHHGHDETFSEDYAAAQAVYHHHHG
jgi:urease accessory protein